MSKIQSKITFTYLLLSLIVVASLGIISSIRIESYFKQRLIDQLSTLANVVALLIEQENLLNPAQLDQRIKAIAGIENVRISVIHADGTVIGDSDVEFADITSVANHFNRPEVREALQNGLGVVTRKSDTVDREFMYVARRISLGSTAIVLADTHVIRVAAPVDDMKRNVSEIRYIILLAGGIVMLIVVGVSFFISRRISKPLIELTRSLEEIRSGNLDMHVEVSTDDEIGTVAKTVNGLLEKLKADIGRMKKLEKFRSEFLGNVSHELRTPIFSIQGFIETLLEGAIDDDAVNRDFLEKAYSHAARLNSLLNDLINISQIESGEMKMSFHSFPVKEFLDAAVKEMSVVAEQHHIVLRARVPTQEEVQVYGDKQRLMQVMRNLVQNAIIYNTPYGEVILSYEPVKGRIRISVSDSGIGIAEEHLPRIFERFYRVDRDRSREVGGTGLGLAIVKHIIEAHESTITVKSTPGRGSVFSFELRRENKAG